MTQMSFDDLTIPVEQVIKQEGNQKTGEQLFWEAELFYQKNDELLAAHMEAAKLFRRKGLSVSARALSEFVRLLAALGEDGVYEMLDIYSGILWVREDPIKLPNHYSAWLSLFLAAQGFDVNKAKSVMDEAWEEVHGSGHGHPATTD